MATQDSPEVIKLRPHHIVAIRHYLSFFNLCEELMNPEVMAEAIRAKNLKFRSFEQQSNQLEKAICIYEGSAMHRAFEICHKLKNSDDILIKIVRGEDEICSGCIFNSSCLNGDYDGILEAFRLSGYAIQGNPLTHDERCLKIEWVQYNQLYSPQELFGEQLRQP